MVPQDIILSQHLLHWLTDPHNAIGGHIFEFLYNTGRPVDLYQFRDFASTQTEVDGTSTRRSISGGETDMIVLRYAARQQLYSSPPRPGCFSTLPA